MDGKTDSSESWGREKHCFCLRLQADSQRAELSPGCVPGATSQEIEWTKQKEGRKENTEKETESKRGHWVWLAVLRKDHLQQP